MKKTRQVAELVQVKSRIDVVEEVAQLLQLPSSTFFVSADSGAGKTALLLQIQCDCDQSFRVISFLDPIHSYGDFIKTLAVALACEKRDEHGKNDV